MKLLCILPIYNIERFNVDMYTIIQQKYECKTVKLVRCINMF